MVEGLENVGRWSMSCLSCLFSIEELEALDQKQLATLNDAIKLQLLTSEEISKIVRMKFHGGGRPRGGRRAL
jgi:hypothetical protein